MPQVQSLAQCRTFLRWLTELTMAVPSAQGVPSCKVQVLCTTHQASVERH